MKGGEEIKIGGKAPLQTYAPNRGFVSKYIFINQGMFLKSLNFYIGTLIFVRSI